MGGGSFERVRDDIADLLHRDAGVRGFSLGAARILRRAVLLSMVSAFYTMDPATLVPRPVRWSRTGCRESVYAQMAAMEFRGEDFNAFSTLGLSGCRGRDAQRGDWRRPRPQPSVTASCGAPNGFGDELRAPLVDDSNDVGLRSRCCA